MESEISYVKAWHEKITIAKVSGHLNVINVFHDVISIFYTVTKIYPEAAIF